MACTVVSVSPKSSSHPRGAPAPPYPKRPPSSSFPRAGELWDAPARACTGLRLRRVFLPVRDRRGARARPRTGEEERLTRWEGAGDAETLAKPPLAASDATTAQNRGPLAPRGARAAYVWLARGIVSRQVSRGGGCSAP